MLSMLTFNLLIANWAKASQNTSFTTQEICPQNISTQRSSPVEAHTRKKWKNLT